MNLKSVKDGGKCLREPAMQNHSVPSSFLLEKDMDLGTKDFKQQSAVSAQRPVFRAELLFPAWTVTLMLGEVKAVPSSRRCSALVAFPPMMC